MKLTDITTSLELAKELKKIGFPQKSLFYWRTDTSNEKESSYVVDYRVETPQLIYCSAPTAEELLEWLPDHINPPFKRNDLFLFFLPVLNDYDIEPTVAKTFTEALAKMVIYLAKNKIINFETK